MFPPLYFGTDREHKVGGKKLHGIDASAGKVLPGSVYFVPKDLFRKFLLQVMRNVSEQGVKKLLIVSAHSGTAQQ